MDREDALKSGRVWGGCINTVRVHSGQGAVLDVWRVHYVQGGCINWGRKHMDREVALKSGRVWGGCIYIGRVH